MIFADDYADNPTNVLVSDQRWYLIDDLSNGKERQFYFTDKSRYSWRRFCGLRSFDLTRAVSSSHATASFGIYLIKCSFQAPTPLKSSTIIRKINRLHSLCATSLKYESRELALPYYLDGQGLRASFWNDFLQCPRSTTARNARAAGCRQWSIAGGFHRQCGIWHSPRCQHHTAQSEHYHGAKVQSKLCTTKPQPPVCKLIITSYIW